MKRETETLIMAAQEQAIRTNLVKAKMERPSKKASAECAVKLTKVSLIF